MYIHRPTPGPNGQKIDPTALQPGTRALFFFASRVEATIGRVHETTWDGRIDYEVTLDDGTLAKGYTSDRIIEITSLPMSAAVPPKPLCTCDPNDGATMWNFHQPGCPRLPASPEVPDNFRLNVAMSLGFGGLTTETVAEAAGVPMAIVQAIREGKRCLADSPRVLAWVVAQEKMGKL